MSDEAPKRRNAPESCSESLSPGRLTGADLAAGRVLDRIEPPAPLPRDDSLESLPVWGFRDTAFAALPNGSVTLTGSRYAAPHVGHGVLVVHLGVGRLRGPAAAAIIDHGNRTAREDRRSEHRPEF